MLVLLMQVHNVDIKRKRGVMLTVDVMKTPLRHAGVLDRRMDDLVATIQRFSNRAAHFQADTAQAIQGKEADLTLAALDQLLPLFEQTLPADVLHPPASEDEDEDEDAPDDEQGLGCLAGLFGLGALAAITVLTSWFTLWILGLSQDMSAIPDPLSPQELNVTQQELEKMLADVEPSPTPLPRDALPPEQDTTPSVVQQAAASVRLHLQVPNDVLAQLACEDLAYVRNWLWAQHGYVFIDDDTQRRFEEDEGYHGLPARPRADIDRMFTDDDKQLRGALNDRMRDLECACPGRLKLNRPCPF
jgi:hypothetical protein